MILRTFAKPTNVIILGTNIRKYTTGFITNKLDITLVNGNKETSMLTDGGFTILTEEEFFEYDFYINPYENPYEDFLLLHDYIGVIESIPHENYEECIIGIQFDKVKETLFMDYEFDEYRTNNKEIFKRLRTINELIN